MCMAIHVRTFTVELFSFMVARRLLPRLAMDLDCFLTAEAALAIAKVAAPIGLRTATAPGAVLWGCCSGGGWGDAVSSAGCLLVGRGTEGRGTGPGIFKG